MVDPGQMQEKINDVLPTVLYDLDGYGNKMRRFSLQEHFASTNNRENEGESLDVYRFRPEAYIVSRIA
jgi:hypothetical protein